MVEAAKRAGAQAAEESMAAEAEAEAAEAARSDLQDQIDQMAEELEAAKKEAADASDRLLRLQADWDNYRRRTAAERIAERERAAEKLVTNLLPVLDDMERASEHATQNAEGDEKVTQFVEGVMAVHAKMLDILSKEGVEVIDPAGQAFDPLVHQAVGREENTEAFDETVAQVYQKGYRMGGKVIRSAMVTVTYGGPKRPAEESEE
ncbi:MAG: nucleotide exchange factor GrpE [Atopobiaceae bacterium]|nr:nucleotide exchange factor GrpE [Atopobiaceae bacterium]